MKTLVLLVMVTSLIMVLTSSSVAANLLPGIEGTNFTRNESLIEEMVRVERGLYVIDSVDRHLPVRPNSRRAGYRTLNNWTFWTTEADPYIRQEVRVINYTSVGITPVPSNRRTYPFLNVPVTLCVNDTTIKNSRTYQVRNNRYCQGFNNHYEFPRQAFGQELILEFNEHPNFEWWLGGDSILGITPQGGGGNGLPICEDITAGLTINRTNGTINFPTLATGIAGYQGPSAGCTINDITFQRNVSGGSGWQVIPTNNDSTAVDCNGQNCLNIGTGAGNTIRTINCDTEGIVRLRTRVRGSTPSNSNRVVFSPVRTLTCLPPEESPTEDPCIPPESSPFVLTQSCVYVNEVVRIYQYVAFPIGSAFFIGLQNASLFFVG